MRAEQIQEKLEKMRNIKIQPLLRKSATEELPYRFRWAYEKIAEHTKRYTESKILDVGPGNGYFLFQLHEFGFNNLTAMINPEEELQKYKDQTQELKEKLSQKIKIVEHDITQTPNPESKDIATYDVITATEVIEHIKDCNAAISNMLMLLKPGGQLLLTTPIEYNYDVPEHIHHFNLYDILEMMDKHADDYKVHYIWKDIVTEKPTIFGIESYRRG